MNSKEQQYKLKINLLQQLNEKLKKEFEKSKLMDQLIIKINTTIKIERFKSIHFLYQYLNILFRNLINTSNTKKWNSSFNYFVLTI